MKWAGHVIGRGRGRNLTVRIHVEDLVVDSGMILKWVFKKIGWGGVAWIYQAARRRILRAIVNTVMNLRVHDMRGMPSLADEGINSEEGLCYMELQGPREL